MTTHNLNSESKLPTEYITRSEAAVMLRCDISTVYNLTRIRKLKAYGLGNQVYYKLTEIEAVLIPL